MRKLILALLLLTALPALAQYTTVTGTVQDKNASVYAGCSISADFVNESSLSQLSLLAGSTFQQHLVGVHCDSNGVIPTFRLADNNQVSPTPSQWRFNVCSQDGKTCFNTLITITGTTQDITTALQTASALLPGGQTNVITGLEQPPASSTITNVCPANSNGVGLMTAVGWVAIPNQANTYAIDECYDTGTGQLTLLAATNAVQPTLSCTPLSLTFPPTNTGATSTQTITCSNTSSISVVFGGATFTTGTYFSQTNTCSTLLVNKSCMFTVVFAPTITSSGCGLTDTLNIVSNAQGSPLAISMCGDGQTPTTPTVSSAAFNISNPTVGIGATTTETSAQTMSDSSVQQLAWPFYNSGTTSVATINAGTGLVTGVAAGTSTLTVNSGGPSTTNAYVGETGGGAGPFTTVTPAQVFNTLGGRTLVAVGWGAATGSVSGVTDTQGNTYAQANAGCLEQANSNSITWYWTTSGTPSGADTVTVTFSGGGVAYPDVVVLAVTGVTAFDQCTVGTIASGTSLASSALTPAQASEIIFSAVVTGNYVKAVNSGSYCLTAGNAGQTNSQGTSCPVSPSGGSVFEQGTFSASAVTPTATLGSSSTGVISSLALKTVSGTTTVTVNNSGGTTYSLSSPPGATVYPYVTGSGLNSQHSLFNQALPNNCYAGNCTAGGGIMAHEITNSDTIARYFATGGGQCSEPGTSSNACEFQIDFAPCGTCGASNSNSSDSGVPIYYSKSTDPWYYLNTGSLGTYFQAPQVGTTGPVFSNGSAGDQFVGVWDNANNIAVMIYKCCTSTGFAMPSSNCSTASSAGVSCNAGSYAGAESAQINADADYNAGQTYKETINSVLDALGNGGEGTNGLGIAPLAAVIRFPEMAAAQVNHALQAGFFCGTNTAPSGGSNGSGSESAYVFPAKSGLLPCGTGGASGIANSPNQPAAGQLFVCDYTSAQISGTTADPWIKAYLTACSEYGIYFTETGNSMAFGFNIPPGGEESQEAYKVMNVTNANMATFCTNNPNDVSCTGTGTNNEAYTYLDHWVPKLTGPGTTDQEGNACSSGCYFSGHLHAINACVVKTLAGVSGGC
jgi:hypothetical protein